MPSSDPLHILLAHDAWATRLVLNLCRDLSREQFHQRFEIGLGSLHDNVTHMISAMRRWTDRLDGRAPRPMLHTFPGVSTSEVDAKDRTVDDLLALHDAAARDFAAVSRAWAAKDLGSTIHVEWPGKEGRKRYTFTRGAVIVHVCTHGTHHRAQCLNMLRHLNIPGLSDNLPDPSAVDWQAETESPGVLLP